MTDNPMEVSVENILVLGAGELGMAVLRHLVPRRKKVAGTVSVLVPPQSLESPNARQAQSYHELRDMDIALLPFDLAGRSNENLIALFGRFHTMLNRIGFVAGPGTRLKSPKRSSTPRFPDTFHGSLVSTTTSSAKVVGSRPPEIRAA